MSLFHHGPRGHEVEQASTGLVLPKIHPSKEQAAGMIQPSSFRPNKIDSQSRLHLERR